MAVPALDTGSIPWASLSPSVDRFVVMLYDEHWSNGGPGPIASRAWARAALTKWIALVGPARIVAAIPAYGYAWHPTKPTDVIGFGTLAALASSSGRIVQRDTLSGGLSLDLPDGSTAWFADAALGAAIAKDARALGVTVLALWRLGLEDPAIWSALGHQ
jgi:spore germination protein YaaH